MNARIDTYAPPQRTATPRGELITFIERPSKRSAPPAFSSGHPGVEFMRSYADQVLAGCGVPGRFRINGRWTDDRPRLVDGFGSDAPEVE